MHTATHVGVQVPGCLEKTHTCTHTQTRTYAQCICTSVCTQIYHMYTDHVNFRYTLFSCRSTYLNVCTCPCTNMYAHRHTALYIHVCTQVQACLHTQTHLHTTAHPHIYRHKTACVHTDGISHVHTCAYRTTFKDLYMFIYIYTCMSFAHSVQTVTRFLSVQQSRIHRQTLGFQHHPAGSASPPPSLMTGSSAPANPNVCPWLPTPRGSPDP